MERVMIETALWVYGGFFLVVCVYFTVVGIRNP